MSNFICPTCGLNNIDCGKAGYKTDKELELEKEVDRLKTIIARTKANGNNPSKISQLKAKITTLSEENAQLKEELSKHKEICCCFENEVLRLENAKLKEQLQKAEKTLQEIEGDWTTEETRIKISEYFNQQIGEK